MLEIPRKLDTLSEDKSFKLMLDFVHLDMILILLEAKIFSKFKRSSKEITNYSK